MKLHLIKTVKLPVWSISYLFNGDSDGLLSHDAELAHDWEQVTFGEYLPITLNMVEESHNFEPFPEFGKACECYKVEVYSSKEND